MTVRITMIWSYKGNEEDERKLPRGRGELYKMVASGDNGDWWMMLMMMIMIGRLR